jgi:radical SAM superfamily enzyme YgiQ (UPF0313 family)
VKEAGNEVSLFDTSYMDFGYTDNNKAGEKAGYWKHVDMAPYGHLKKPLDLTTEYGGVLQRENPDMVMMSILSSEVNVAKEIIRLTKLSSKAKIVIGGKHPSITGESLGADITCIGEGVPVLPQILNGECSEFIMGDWFQDLDGLPHLDWEEYGEESFWRPYQGKAVRAGDHMITWGCPNNCHYCSNEFFHKLYANDKPIRQYSVSEIVLQLFTLSRKYKLDFWKFHDENFFLKSREYLDELSWEYGENVGVPFTCLAHAKTVTEDKVQFLKRMGCVNVSIGVETGDVTMRKLMGRKDTIEDLQNAFDLLHKYDIGTTSFNMLGLPFESRETYRATVELNKRLKPRSPLMNFFYPYEGTKLRDVSIRLGFFDPDNCDVHRWDRPALKFGWLSEGEMIEMRESFARKVLG